VDAGRTDGARTSGGKAPIAAQCANTSSQLLARRDILQRHASLVADGIWRASRRDGLLQKTALLTQADSGESISIANLAYSIS
jgi:hypothetical protein